MLESLFLLRIEKLRGTHMFNFADVDNTNYMVLLNERVYRTKDLFANRPLIVTSVCIAHCLKGGK